MNFQHRAQRAFVRIQETVRWLNALWKKKMEERRQHRELGNSGLYEGPRKPAMKTDKLTRLEVPTWSTGLFATAENVGMLACSLTGIGICIIHGHTQDGLSQSISFS